MKAAQIKRQLDQVTAERRRLVTDQPEGWEARYAELGVKSADLARRWESAHSREESARILGRGKR